MIGRFYPFFLPCLATAFSPSSSGSLTVWSSSPSASRIAAQASNGVENENQNAAYHSFNGGKMEHIFKMERVSIEGQKKWQTKYVDEFSSDLAREALEMSDKMYWKIDGSCGILRYDSETDSIDLYQRIDTRGKEASPILENLPSTGCKNPTAYTSSKPHTYFMEKIEPRGGDGKKQKKNKAAVMDLLNRNKSELKNLILSGQTTTPDQSASFLSVEIVGTKYNQTPGVDSTVGIAPHCQQRISASWLDDRNAALPRTFGEAEEFLLGGLGYAAEGIVIEYQGKYWKLVSKLFDEDCVFATNKDRVMPPVVFFD